MKLKIEGEITPERVAEVVANAIATWESSQPGGKFYGAKLYLAAFDAEGERHILTDNLDNPLVITIPAPPGTIVRPALTAEGRQCQRARCEAERQQKIQDAALQCEHDA